MGEITEANTKALIESEDYPDEKLTGFVDDLFSIEFDKLLTEKNISTSYLVEHCEISKSYAHELRNLAPGKNKKRPNKYKLIDICIEIGASLEETQKLLRLAGVAELYSRKQIDSYIMWGLSHKKNGTEIKEILHERGLDLYSDTDRK